MMGVVAALLFAKQLSVRIFEARTAPRMSLRFCDSTTRYTMQQFDEPKEAELSISVSDPVMENRVYRNGRAKTEFLQKQEY